MGKGKKSDWLMRYADNGNRCERCNELFAVPTDQYQKRRFCSRLCRALRHNQRKGWKYARRRLATVPGATSYAERAGL